LSITQRSDKKTVSGWALNKGRGLKIAVLIRNFVVTGGAERYAFQVARLLAETHEVHIFCQTFGRELATGFTIHRVPKPLPGPSFLNQLIFSHYCKRMVDPSFDIIQSHERVGRFDLQNIHCPCYRGFLTRAKGIKKALLWLGELTSPRGLAYLGLEKNQFNPRPGRRYIADSAMTQDDVIENYHLSPDLFTIAYPGVDFNAIDQAMDRVNRDQARAELGLKPEDLAIVFVGTEFKRKGLDGLLAALALVDDKRVKLVVVGGGGGDIETYRRMAGKLALTERVYFAGLLPDIYPCYIAADIFCLPTLADPCPIAPIEAMACGTATIMSRVPFCGTAEHVKDNEAVILDDPRDPEEIRAAISRLLDPDERGKIAEKGKKTARKITWQAAAAATEEAISLALADREKGR